MPSGVVDLEDFKARRMAERGPLRFTEARLDEAAGHVVLTVDGVPRELSPAAATALGQRLLELGELAKGRARK